MYTVDEMTQFVLLRDMVQNVEFVDRPDEIAWLWIPTGTYRSAYLAQFSEAYDNFIGDYIWKAHA
jgi:hypothetical protein